MSFKFLHAADLHLDSPLRGLERYEGAPVDEVRGASRRALENLVQLAIAEQVAFVLLAGDIYDGDWKDFNTGLFFGQQMLKLREANIPVVAIHGNHDAANKMTRSLQLRDSVRVLSTKSPETVLGTDLGMTQLDVAFHGLSFASPSVAENVVPSYPTAEPHCFNIGMLHTSLDYESQSGHARYAPCKLADLAGKGYQYWALGHIHQRTTCCADPLIVYPGNPQGRHIREGGIKGCVLVSVDDRQRATVEFRPLDVLRWVHCQIPAQNADEPEELVERFAGEMKIKWREHRGVSLAVRVTLAGRCRAHRQLVAAAERWANEIRLAALDATGGGAWVEKIQWQTSLPQASDRASQADGPLGELLQTLVDLRTDEAALKQLSNELDDVRRKLPEELNMDADWRRLDDPARLAEYLDEVETLLLARLEAQEEPP